jgi:hypothetical protein
MADGTAAGQHFTARWAEERGDRLRDWSTLGGLRTTCRARFGHVAQSAMARRAAARQLSPDAAQTSIVLGWLISCRQYSARLRSVNRFGDGVGASRSTVHACRRMQCHWLDGHQSASLIRGGRPSTVGRRGALRACPCVAGCGSSTTHNMCSIRWLRRQHGWMWRLGSGPIDDCIASAADGDVRPLVSPPGKRVASGMPQPTTTTTATTHEMWMQQNACNGTDNPSSPA